MPGPALLPLLLGMGASAGAISLGEQMKQKKGRYDAAMGILDQAIKAGDPTSASLAIDTLKKEHGWNKDLEAAANALANFTGTAKNVGLISSPEQAATAAGLISPPTGRPTEREFGYRMPPTGGAVTKPPEVRAALKERVQGEVSGETPRQLSARARKLEELMRRMSVTVDEEGKATYTFGKPTKLTMEDLKVGRLLGYPPEVRNWYLDLDIRGAQTVEEEVDPKTGMKRLLVYDKGGTLLNTSPEFRAEAGTEAEYAQRPEVQEILKAYGWPEDEANVSKASRMLGYDESVRERLIEQRLEPTDENVAMVRAQLEKEKAPTRAGTEGERAYTVYRQRMASQGMPPEMILPMEAWQELPGMLEDAVRAARPPVNPITGIVMRATKMDQHRLVGWFNYRLGVELAGHYTSYELQTRTNEVYATLEVPYEVAESISAHYTVLLQGLQDPSKSALQKNDAKRRFMARIAELYAETKPEKAK